MKFDTKFGENFNLYCDNMDPLKSFEINYAAFPERGFIVKNNNVEYVSFGGPVESEKWFGEMTDFLQKLA